MPKVTWELPGELAGMAVKQVNKNLILIAIPVTGKKVSKSGKTTLAFSSGGFRPLGDTDMSVSINITKPRN